MNTRAVLFGLCAALAALAVWTPGAEAQAADGPTVMIEGKEYKSGDRYWQPMNSETNSIPLFSENLQVVSIYNKTAVEMTVNSIALSRGEGVMDEEFTLWTGEGKRAPYVSAEAKLEAGKGSTSVRLRFFPVVSGERNATLTVTYNGDKKFELKVAGRGAGAAKFFTGGKEAWHKVLGGAATDEMISSAVADKEGNLYVSGSATQLHDKFATDFLFARINADGTLGWAKLWNAGFRDLSPDSGQNAETGGTAGSIALDEEGSLYIAGLTSDSKSNNNFAALVMKINPADGAVVWEKLWRPDWPKNLLASHSAEAYALDARGGRVYVTGVSAGNAEVLLLALNAADGAIAWQTSLDITPGSNDRGYAVKAAADGSLVISGLASDRAFLAKVSGANTEAPKVAWLQRVDLGRGSGINAVDVDAEGNIYASCDRRGATTFFSAIKVSPEGKLLWGKTYKGTAGDRSNTHVVKVNGDQVLVGGRLGVQTFDTTGGDAIALCLNAADGAERWSAFYYTGTGPDEACEHRIKALLPVGGDIVVVGQAYSGSRNGERFWGYWYNGPSEYEDFAPALETVTVAEGALKPVAKGACI
ncbi:MAG: PQQ-binding-like beta-propeller repeat protein, partial [Planctomycetes bacterium]|nr:PQQ-binding-like beta-propeller repeat protein [Planctomycetota bacterium]